MKDKVIFWTPTIDSLRIKEGNIGGIAVQMNYWAEEFLRNGWKVYSLSKYKFKTYDGIRFLYFPYIRYVRFFIEILLPFVYFVFIRPKLIISRGADRQVAFLSFFSNLLGIKYVHFAASDNDFVVEGVTTRKTMDNKLYFWGVKRLKYIVVQNDNQVCLLRKNCYRSQKILMIPNVWKTNKCDEVEHDKTIDFLWVGNFRDVKRPEWFLELAKKHPTYQFAMIGGSFHDEIYMRCKEESKGISNLLFHGKMDFYSVNQYFKNVRCLVCTSYVEGFPNTFLQAWANSIPVLTSFDPSGRVVKYGLGMYVTDFDEMNIAIPSILGARYKTMKSAIDSYFVRHHSVESRFQEIIHFVN